MLFIIVKLTLKNIFLSGYVRSAIVYWSWWVWSIQLSNCVWNPWVGKCKVVSIKVHLFPIYISIILQLACRLNATHIKQKKCLQSLTYISTRIIYILSRRFWAFSVFNIFIHIHIGDLLLFFKWNKYKIYNKLAACQANHSCWCPICHLSIINSFGLLAYVHIYVHSFIQYTYIEDLLSKFVTRHLRKYCQKRFALQLTGQRIFCSPYHFLPAFCILMSKPSISI